MNSAMVNPMPERAAPPAMRGIVSPGARRPMQMPHQGRCPGDADELAEHQAGTMPPTQRRDHGVGERRRVEPHARVGEGEHGQHDEAMYGDQAACSRSLIEIESRRLRVAARA